MIASLRADLVRLRTLPSSYVVPTVMLGLVALITGSSLTQAGSSGMTTATQLREPVTASAGIMLAIGMALFAAMRVGGEYRYDTMSQRLLAMPDRRRLLASILTLHGVLGMVVAALGLAIGLGIAYPMLAGDDLSMHLTPSILAAPVFAVVVFSLIGASCAIILRSQAAAVLVIVGAFVAEKLVGIFVGGAAEYLPYGSLTPLLRLEGAGTGAAPAAGALGLTALLLMTTAAVLFDRRDITP